LNFDQRISVPSPRLTSVAYIAAAAAIEALEPT
jgi:hypothetical protein